MRDFNGQHILKNITENEEPFKCNESLLLQVVDGIQRGLHTHNISHKSGTTIIWRSNTSWLVLAKISVFVLWLSSPV